MNRKFSTSMIILLTSIAVLPVSIKQVAAGTQNFGSKVPSVDEFVAALKPQPRMRGIRPVSVLSEPSAVSMSIKFAFNSANLDEASQQTLDNLSKALKNPELTSSTFVIEGHTDATGSEEYNMSLSERRARSVKNYLLAKGVPADELSTVGKGETDLLDPSKPYDGVNRRVAIVNVRD